jgi:hypothetical protein
LARNEWHRNFYYAVATQNLPGVLPSVGGCGGPSDCLRFNDPLDDPANRNIRVLLVLAGSRLATQSRHNNTLTNYLEYQNADGGTMYEERSMRVGRVATPALNAPWNDRVILVDWAADLIPDLPLTLQPQYYCPPPFTPPCAQPTVASVRVAKLQ